jgi:hypothetical protein
MKGHISSCILFLICLTGYSQTDTLFLKNEKIACKYIKIKTDSITYKAVSSEALRSVSKKEVDKIVYKNGKTFSVKDDISMKHVEGVSNFNDVAITFIESEVEGFSKIMDVEVKYQHVTLNSQSKALDKAYRLLKIQASMKGANVIYIPEQPALKMSEEPDTTVTKLYGIAYCDKLPSVEAFEKMIGEKNDFAVTDQWYRHVNRQDVYQFYFNGRLTIDEIRIEEGIIYLDGELKSFPRVHTFRLVSIANRSFMLYFEMGENVYNVRVYL